MREVINRSHGQQQMQLFVGFNDVNPRSTVVPDQVMAVLKVSIFQLLP